MLVSSPRVALPRLLLLLLVLLPVLPNLTFTRPTAHPPGLLERGDLARGGEGLTARLVPSISVAQVASVMIAEAEKAHKAGGGGVAVLEMKALQKYVVAGAA